MTAQVREILIYNNVEYRMANLPLSTFLETISHKYEFENTLSCCWRGYIGTWEIINDKLFLIHLSGTTNDDIDFTTELLFPGHGEIFAEWYSGELRIPIGEQLLYYDARYGPVYDENLFLEIEKGRLIKSYIINNKENIVKSNGELRMDKDQTN